MQQTTRSIVFTALKQDGGGQGKRKRLQLLETTAKNKIPYNPGKAGLGASTQTGKRSSLKCLWITLN